MEIVNKLLSQQLPAVIVVFSFIAAFIIDFLFSVVFKRFASKTKTNFDDNLIQILHKPIFYSTFFLVFYVFLVVFDVFLVVTVCLAVRAQN